MWRYEKRLQYPVKITQSNPKMAQFIMSQYGGPDGGNRWLQVVVEEEPAVLPVVDNLF